MLDIFEISNIIDLLYNYFSLKIIYYMSKKFKIKFQLYIRLIYGRDQFTTRKRPICDHHIYNYLQLFGLCN
jgi:hypothetical protein